LCPSHIPLCIGARAGQVSTGKTHARHRGIISKHFVFDNLRSIFPIFTGRAQALAQAWSRLPEGTEVEVRAHGLCLIAASVDWVCELFARCERWLGV
jgi:hypothetical protein